MAQRVLVAGFALLFAAGCGSGDDGGGGRAGSGGGTGGGSTGGNGGSASGGDGGTAGGARGDSGSTSNGGSGGGTGGATGGSGGGSGGTFPVSDCGAATLKDLAASAPAGAFTDLTGSGLDAQLIDANQGHQIFEYSDKGVWDPNTCQALFLGGGHLSLVKYIGFSASADSWFQAPNPPWWCDPQTVSNPYQCATHAYQHDALDPATGTFYFRGFNSATVRRHQVDATIDADWDTIPDLPSDAASCIATSLEYFPERDELVYVDCTNQSLRTWKPGGNSWSSVSGPFAMGAYHNYGVYNPVHKVILFGLGNGSKGLHAYDQNGSVKTVASPPREFHPSPDNSSTLRIFTVDPATGKYLAVAPNGDMFEYDVPGDSWAALSQKAPTDLQIAIPVSSYGVVLFVSAYPPKAYIYKH